MCFVLVLLHVDRIALCLLQVIGDLWGPPTLCGGWILYLNISCLLMIMALESITSGVFARVHGCIYLWLHPLCNSTILSALEC